MKIDTHGIRLRWEADGSKRDERGKRLFAASEVRAAGYGGLAAVSRITGIARSTINRGEDDLDLAPPPAGRVRREGGGGSNGARVRLWKLELQKLADEIRLPIKVCHYPPGTSKWNKIEHRLFCHITQNWRGRPLTSVATMIELIGATTTKRGLKVECALDPRSYEKGIKVSDAEMRTLDIRGDTFHPEWNYTAWPRTSDP